MAGDTDPDDAAAQEAAQARVAEQQRLQRAREVDDFKWLMGNVQGRRIMWRLLSMCGVFRNPYTPGAPEGNTEFRCGEMNIGQQLMAETHSLTPERYNVMVEEHQRWLKMQAQ